MKYSKCAAIILIAMAAGFPLFAGGNNYEKSFSLEHEQRLTIDQTDLRLATVGITFYPIAAQIRSYDGDELVVRVNENSIFGNLNPVEVDAVADGEELKVVLGFRRNMIVGIVIGSLDIEILVPSEWDGELKLVNMKIPTAIEKLDIRRLSGNTSITEMSTDYCIFDVMDIDLGADSDLMMFGTEVGTCRIRGSLGKVDGKRLDGMFDIETVDGDISLDFARFTGTTRLSSALGSVAVALPADTSSELVLRSKLNEVSCELPLVSISNQNPRLIRGSIGSIGSDNLLSVSTGDGKISIIGCCR